MMVVVDVFVPAATSWLVVASGATAATVGSLAMASASSRVSVPEEDPPPVGLIVSRLVPRLDSRFVMFEVVPWPTPTSATTEATPMITPSIVSAARRRLVRRRDSARRSSSRTLMPRPARRAGGSGGRRPARSPGRG